MHIHILGICGTFMGGVAVLARAAGHTVTGCDGDVYPPMSDQLREQGIELHRGYDAEQLQQFKADVFVVGNAMTRVKYPIVEAILDAGLPYVSGPQWLAENVLQGKHVLAVAGTHGKTTTSAMLAWILACAAKNPGFLIGGVPSNFHVSALYTASPYFVVEADEYDTAFFDKRSKFVHYRPRTAILNNLEFDHADIFPDIGAIETQFHHLVRTVPKTGRLIVNGAEESLHRVIGRGLYSEVEYFGDELNARGGWRVKGESDGVFDVLFGETPVGRVEWQLSGRHNRQNALAAIAAARHVGVPPAEACRALGQFLGVKRRMEVKGTVRGITVYDDFAHHPTAVATTIAGLRRRIKAGERIIAVLEPRSNTMKLGTMKAALPQSLQSADLTYCYANNLGWDVGDALKPLGTRAAVYSDLDVLVKALGHVARPGDHLLVMSNGGFGGVHQKLLTALAA
jgi:UDP-N-acetylmuramate: L-alanyl-gamma-D-glutamyl-meso-diaminopimelate ligase